MKYNLIKLIRNTQDQYVAQIETYDTSDGAKVAYHNTLAAFHDAADVLLATAKIVDEFGHDLKGFAEVVDHRPEPEEETNQEE